MANLVSKSLNSGIVSRFFQAVSVSSGRLRQIWATLSVISWLPPRMMTLRYWIISRIYCIIKLISVSRLFQAVSVSSGRLRQIWATLSVISWLPLRMLTLLYWIPERSDRIVFIRPDPSSSRICSRSSLWSIPWFSLRSKDQKSRSA